MKQRISLLCALLCALLCVGVAFNACLAEPAAALSAAELPDYSSLDNWAYFGIGQDQPADLFLICPTVDTSDALNMSLDDDALRVSFVSALEMQRGIYEGSTRMYAPYYRQASMRAYELSAEEREVFLAFAYSDVSAAFAWYLENENQGRPIVLAGFSQGADMCYRLLQEYFGDAALLDQLVAVYAIGWPCTEALAAQYPQIRPAQSADDIGVVISFDCEVPSVEETFSYPAGQKAYAINPLNWRTDSVPADRTENLGACFFRRSGELKREEIALCGCYLDTVRGVLKVTDLDPAEYPPVVPGLPDGALHLYDYQLFFRNLEENVKTRVTAYLSAQAASPEK